MKTKKRVTWAMGVIGIAQVAVVPLFVGHELAMASTGAGLVVIGLLGLWWAAN